jgi:DNA repair exonuclease SbcCD ATPase subunit
VLAKIGPLRANFEGQILELKASNATFVGQIQELQASKETFVGQIQELQASKETSEGQILELQASKETSEGQILELKASHTKLEEEHKKLEQQHDKLQRDMLLRAATLGDVRTLSQVGGAEASGSPPLTPRSLHVHMTTKAAKRARLTLPPGFAFEDVAKPTQPSPARPRARE